MYDEMIEEVRDLLNQGKTNEAIEALLRLIADIGTKVHQMDIGLSHPS